MSVLLSCLLSVASSHPVVLRTRLGRGLCRSVTLRAVSCCAQQQHTSLAERRCTPEPPAVLALREETEQLMPSGAHMMSGAQQGRLLQMLVRLSRAQRVLELGCFTGYATLWMALGLVEGGRVVTCERDERAAEVARRHFAMAGVTSRVELVMGDALDAVRGDALEGAPFRPRSSSSSSSSSSA